MKHSLKKRYHAMLAILFLIIILQFVAVLYSISGARDIMRMASDIQSILLIFLFALFIYLVIIYNYLPFKLKRSIDRVRELVEEISEGNYHLDIESSLLGQDEDFTELIYALQKMLDILRRFDSAKSEKIYEHHQRIGQLIDLLPMDVIIAGISGDLVYLNDKFRLRYPAIDDGMNLNELFFKDKYNTQIFDTLQDALRLGNNIYDEVLVDEEGKQQVLIKGSIVRNTKGNASGAVFTLEYSGEKN
ncbi:MAG: hypothetical protein PHC50_01395 [Candidatus Cloacimonetes bacterium]|nr:hypothetical protein [Candidatus Cloacimonadota bacterium]